MQAGYCGKKSGATVRALHPTTVGEAADAFLAYLKRRNRSPLTIKQYKPTLDLLVEWGGDVSPALITTARIDFGFLVWWEEQFIERNGREPGAQTTKAIHGVLGSFYAFLSNYGFLTDEDGKAVRNPMLAIQRPSVKQRRNDWLRKSEDDALLDTPMSEIEEILVWLFRWAGLRMSEGLNLRNSDIDFVEGTIRVHDSKTESGIREVPIVPELRPRMKAWIAFVQSRGVYLPNGPFLCTTRTGRWKDKKTGQVLESEPGGGMKPQTVEKIVRRVGERAGIGRLTPQRLRRTFGSHLINLGLRLETISKLQGHSNTAITEKAYAQLLNETIRNELLNALMGRS